MGQSVQLDWSPYAAEGRIHPSDDWSTLVFVKVYMDGHLPVLNEDTEHLLGYVFVVGGKFDSNRMYLPGGRKGPRETPLGTGRRELHEETGLLLPERDFKYKRCLARKSNAGRGNHWSALCVVCIQQRELGWMNSDVHGNSGEIPLFVTVEEFKKAVIEKRFVRAFYNRLENTGLVEPVVTNDD